MHDPAAKIQEGWDAVMRRDLAAAERLFASAAEEAPETADAWNGLGAVHFERGELEESLKCYERARDAAARTYGGKMPAKLTWTPDDKPALRALHGIGLNKFRAGDFEGAEAAFEDLLRRNPDDNQGAHFLLDDIKKKKNLWKEDL
ncbi:MAG TPA: tetratricopeptide repeat protein [Candidatus Binatia bacterium]|jgi:Flp pilus assembly protein TadD|nr:tetratricopeptide repeat protein [Candidatus Binatia bacterium]